MKKIDKKLLNFIILSNKECNLEGIVYFFDKNKTLKFFNNHNIKIIKELSFLNAFVVCLNSDKILNIAKQEFIAYISSVADVTALMDISNKILGTKNLHATGHGVALAIIDTGINSHLDFVLGKNRIIKFCDFVNGYEMPYDDNGHGTFVAGVAAGKGLVSNGKYSGILPIVYTYS